jgi:hypothetical protein
MSEIGTTAGLADTIETSPSACCSVFFNASISIADANNEMPTSPSSSGVKVAEVPVAGRKLWKVLVSAAAHQRLAHRESVRLCCLPGV